MLTGIIAGLTEWRRFIVASVFLSAVISLVIALLIPPKFKAAASVLPAEQADLFGSLEGISTLARSFTPARGLAALRGSDELDRYAAILQSGRVLTRVIEEFDLVHVYGITSYPRERTVKELLSNVDISVENEGYLTVTVYDRSADRAAKMANFFVDELNRTNSDLQAQNARANRSFIEERYTKNLRDLTAAEDSLKAFQKRYGVIAMPEQTEASVKAGAELAAKLASEEVQLGIEERTQSPEHPTVKALRIEVDELRKKLSSMNRAGTDSPGDINVLVPFASIPELGAEYLRKYREVEIQYKILQFITPLYEQSKVEERRETPSVIVLDRAYAAERKSKPKRLFIVLGGMLIGFILSVGYAGARTRWLREQEKNSKFYGVVRNLLNALSIDLRFHRYRARNPGSHGQQHQ